MPGNADKHVNIIFVKAPSSSSQSNTEVILPEQPRQKVKTATLCTYLPHFAIFAVRTCIYDKLESNILYFCRLWSTFWSAKHKTLMMLRSVDQDQLNPRNQKFISFDTKMMQLHLLNTVLQLQLTKLLALTMLLQLLALAMVLHLIKC